MSVELEESMNFNSVPNEEESENNTNLKNDSEK